MKQKTAIAIKVSSGKTIPVQFIKKNIKSWRLLLLSEPPKRIRVRDQNSHKLIFAE